MTKTSVDVYLPDSKKWYNSSMPILCQCQTHTWKLNDMPLMMMNNIVFLPNLRLYNTSNYAAASTID